MKLTELQLKRLTSLINKKNQAEIDLAIAIQLITGKEATAYSLTGDELTITEKVEVKKSEVVSDAEKINRREI